MGARAVTHVQAVRRHRLFAAFSPVWINPCRVLTSTPTNAIMTLLLPPQTGTRLVDWKRGSMLALRGIPAARQPRACSGRDTAPACEALNVDLPVYGACRLPCAMPAYSTSHAPDAGMHDCHGAWHDRFMINGLCTCS